MNGVATIFVQYEPNMHSWHILVESCIHMQDPASTTISEPWTAIEIAWINIFPEIFYDQLWNDAILCCCTLTDKRDTYRILGT